jgi:hypothetical protein
LNNLARDSSLTINIPHSASSCSPSRFESVLPLLRERYCTVLTEAPISGLFPFSLQRFPSFLMRPPYSFQRLSRHSATAWHPCQLYQLVWRRPASIRFISVLLDSTTWPDGSDDVGKIGLAFLSYSHDILGRPGYPRQVAFFLYSRGLFKQLVIIRLFPPRSSSSKHADQPVSPFSSHKNAQ